MFKVTSNPNHSMNLFLSPPLCLYLKEAVSKFVESVFRRSLCFNGQTKGGLPASKCIPAFVENQKEGDF